MAERKGVLLRLDPAVHDALARWASDELRSTNAQIEFLLRRALGEAGRLPGNAGKMRGRGRPPANEGRADDGGADDGPADDGPADDGPADDGPAGQDVTG
jgi:hypothetical protein